MMLRFRRDYFWVKSFQPSVVGFGLNGGESVEICGIFCV
jgi:hypothetical protein